MPFSHLPLFIVVVQCFLPETVVPHISTGQIPFSLFCASYTISPQQFCLIWAFFSTWGVTLERNPNFLVWGPQQGLTEAKETTTCPQTLSYPLCLWGVDHWHVGLHALGSVLLPGADWRKRFHWNIHLRKRIDNWGYKNHKVTPGHQGCLCKSHFTAAGLFHSDICCADGKGAMFRMTLPWTPATQEPGKSAI